MIDGRLSNPIFHDRLDTFEENAGSESEAPTFVANQPHRSKFRATSSLFHSNLRQWNGAPFQKITASTRRV